MKGDINTERQEPEGGVLLNLILGRAGTGKTAFIMNEIKRRMDEGQSGLLLIVPEQYSHDAERQLCAVCGDALSLHGETLSFSRLCGRVFLEMGEPAKLLDRGGQLLVTQRALESVASRLKIYGIKGLRAELPEKMLDAILEFKSLGLTPESLESMVGKAASPLADKLRDLALIYSSYNALLHVRGGDSADRMALLAELIGESSIGDEGHIYFDGFNDFTVQELRVIEELLEKNADITVSLTCDMEDDSEVFELPRRTAHKLCSLADKCGSLADKCGSLADKCGNLADKYGSLTDKYGSLTDKYGAKAQVVRFSGFPSPSNSIPVPVIDRRFAAPAAPELAFLEKYMFTAGTAQYPGRCGAISIYSAPTRYAECEYAAVKALELVRAGYRWRDIAVMARNWGEYGTMCEIVLEKHGIPFFSGGRADILSKPPIALLENALEVAAGGWEYKPVFKYVKTGLTGIRPCESDELENYVIKWNIRGSMWTREWILPPSGCGGEEEEVSALARLNKLRRSITEPLLRLRDGIKGITEAGAKLRALYAFFEDIGLPDRLREKAESLEKRGERRLADEYSQLWGVIRTAMEQSYAILGDVKLSAAEFRKGFSLVLSRYDVGVIPVSLDRTALGGMEMSRRRDVKCLILLGATDENMPMLTKGDGALSDSDREEMRRLGAEMPTGLEDRMFREMNMLYSTLTLPSNELAVVYPACGGVRPSLVVKRLMTMFGLAVKQGSVASQKGAASQETGASQESGPSASIERRTRTAPLLHAERLYGRELSLSPTRVEKYYSCPFQHFLQSGLKLNPRVTAEFDAPAAGLFMHYVLEGVTSEVKKTVGFKNTDEGLCRKLTERYIEEYVRDFLYNFEGKSTRFVYLFRLLEEEAYRIARDMLDELKNSDFEPLDFELKISELSGAAEKGFDGLSLKGAVDRVDGWKSGGKLYLRVIDYKTGRKSFDLSDVMYGRDMQMLIYLLALQKFGHERYGAEIVPAGVLYVPARDVLLNAPRNVTEEELKKSREKELKRGGLLLNDPSVLEAMENGDERKYLPVKLTKDGKITGDSLVSQSQVGLLSKHVSKMLSGAASEILGGSIGCSPYYKSDNDNACLYCQYHAVCAFDEEAGDRRRFLRKMKAAEIWEKLMNSEYEDASAIV